MAVIPGCPKHYATEQGEIVNAKGKVLRQWSESRNGALRVRVCGKNRMVGFLVLTAYSGHPPSGDFRVKYVNGDCTDNRPVNLAWARRREKPLAPQSPTVPSALEAEYERLSNERYSIIELMQT